MMSSQDRYRQRTARRLIWTVLLGWVFLSLLWVRTADSAMLGHVAVSVMVGDAIIDSDDDGIDDAWEQEHFSGLGIATAESDYDEDGFPDLHEYQAGTDPRDPDSLLRIERIEVQPGHTVNVVWQSSTNLVPAVRRYDVFSASSPEVLQTGGTMIAVGVQSQGEETVLTPSTGGTDRRVFRVRLRW